MRQPAHQTGQRILNWRERAATLRTVPLHDILQRCGARLDPSDPHKWHTNHGVLTVTGTKFINWHTGCGGGGAIDLVMHLQGIGFGLALEWLQHHFGTAEIAVALDLPPKPRLLTLPPPHPENLEHVRRYLIQNRRLPPALLDSVIQAGDLYADNRGNAVFVARNQLGSPIGAELRGTSPGSWRGMAPGSRKDLGVFAVPRQPSLAATALCESAIDALSCHALHPQYRCLSTAGARPNPAWLADLLLSAHPLYCGFDLDPVGEAMASSMLSLYPSIQRLRPSRKDWNDVLRCSL
jgi:hypothetical protein